MDRIQSFEQLTVWQESQEFAVEIYHATRSFPKDEQYGITNQIRRAVTSISANIAEGFGRNSTKEKLQFYTIAYGSLLETKNFIYLFEKLQFLTSEEAQPLLDHAIICQKLLNAYKRAHRQ